MFTKYNTIILCLVFILTNIVHANYIEQSVSQSHDNVFYVGGSGPGNYTRIQDAIDAASTGDTVFVFSGVYYENVVISKVISLIGEDRGTTIIDGRGTNSLETVLIENCNGVMVSGFTIKESGNNHGLLALSTNVCETKIHDCRFTNSGDGFDGVVIWQGDNNLISECVFEKSIDGPGIQLWEGENNIIRSCVFNSAYIRQYVDNKHLKIIDCEISDIGYGLFISSADNFLIENCTISNTLVGILIERMGSDNKIINCSITNSRDYGIYCDGEQTRIQIKDCYIAETLECSGIHFFVPVTGSFTGCTFENNCISGLSFWTGFRRCTIAYNTFKNNGYGIQSRGKVHMLNNVHHNTFIDNDGELKFWDLPFVFGVNRWSDNYWSDWSGIGPYHVFGLLNWDFNPRMTPLL